MSQSLSHKIAVSAVWTYFSYAASKLAAFVTTAILARLLSQTEFGIVGFALTAMSFLDAVRELGMGNALIRRRDRVEEAANTVFWSTLATNVLVWILLSLSAPAIANFFHEPKIIPILPIISFTFILSGLGSTHDALLQREMGFRRRVIPTLGSSIIKAIVSIGMALMGFGVWALVIGQVASRASYTIITWYIVKWRPQFRFDRGLFGETAGYGLKLSFDSLLSAIEANVDYVFIGRFLGEAALGIYTIAFRVPELIIINLATMVANVLYPAYSSMQDDLVRLRAGLLGTLRYISLVTIPLGVGLALVSPQFVAVVFGAKWADAAPIMSMLSIYGTILTISWNIGDVYKAINRADILWKTALLELALLAPILYILAQQSALAVGVGQVIVASVISVMRLLIALRLLKLQVKTMAAQFVPAMVCGSIMAVVLVIASHLVSGWANLPALILLILLGAIAYLAPACVFEWPLCLRLVHAARKQFLPKSIKLGEASEA